MTSSSLRVAATMAVIIVMVLHVGVVSATGSEPGRQLRSIVCNNMDSRDGELERNRDRLPCFKEAEHVIVAESSA